MIPTVASAYATRPTLELRSGALSGRVMAQVWASLTRRKLGLRPDTLSAHLVGLVRWPALDEEALVRLEDHLVVLVVDQQLAADDAPVRAGRLARLRDPHP